MNTLSAPQHPAIPTARSRWRDALRGLLSLGLLFAAGTSLAQAWPTKPVRIVVTFTAGGAADFTARLVGEKLSEAWKQQVVVENRIGAGGNIGVEAVFRAPADGYTMLLASSAQPINLALYPKLPFDLFADFAPVALVATAPMAVAVHPRMKESSLRELTALLRATPGKVSYATCGVATSHHFAFELYKFRTKTYALHIPYRGCAAAVVDTVGGQIETVISSLNTLLPHQKTGKLKVLAVTSKNRSPSAPDVPTFRESGVPELKDYESTIYYGFMVRSGTPAEIVSRMESDLRRVMAMPDVAERINRAGLEVGFSSAAEMGAAMRNDAAQVKQIIDYAGIKPE